MPVPQPGVWGIDLGQCALKAIRLEMIDGEVTATAFDYIEHPKILSQPDADPDQLTREALDKFLSRNNLRGDQVVISVPGQSGLARFVKLPPVEERKIADIVKFEAKQQIPFPLEEVVWDFQKLSAGLVTDGFALETEIGLFAMKRDMVNRALQHFHDVNVEVHIVQMAPLALVNFVAHDLLGKAPEGGQAAGQEDEKEEEEQDEEAAGKKQCVVALDIGTDNSNLVITDGEKIIWQRPIPLGGNHFTRALTKDLKLTFAKAEHLKRNAVKSPDLKKILASLRPVLNDFVGEVQRSLGYFTNTHKDAHVKYMVGLGNAFRLPGLQKFLQEKLQLEVRKLSGFKRLKGETVTSAPQFTENILSFAVAHGLALQGLKLTRLHTNLLPEEIRVERLVRAKKPWAAAAAAVLLLGIAGLAFGRARQMAAYNNPAVDKVLKEGADLAGKKSSLDSQFTTITGEIEASRAAVRKMAGGVSERLNWVLFPQYINECLPRISGDGTRVERMAKLTIRGHEPFKLYATPGLVAFRNTMQRRAAGPKDTPTAAELKQEKKDKENSIQLNVEGITGLYSNDLPTFFKNLKEAKGMLLEGMRSSEAEMIRKGDDKLPKEGWLVEIRGFTYHKDGKDFVIDTLVENLASPESAGITLPAEMKQLLFPENKETKQADRKIRFVFLYKYDTEKNYQSGVFTLINTSWLNTALGSVGAAGQLGPGAGGLIAGRGAAPGAGKGMPSTSGEKESPAEGAKPSGPNRDSWRPLGEVASGSLGGAPTGGMPGMPGMPGAPPGVSGAPPGAGNKRLRQGFGMPALPGGVPIPGKTPGTPLPPGTEAEPPPEAVARTEFVIFFVWQEPLPPEPDEGTTPTPTPAS
jgi:type IV pilus assembly protein PilM